MSARTEERVRARARVAALEGVSDPVRLDLELRRAGLKPLDYSTLDVKERAKLMRAALKARGWNSRLVSVRLSRFAGGASVDATVNSARVPLGEVEAMIRAFETVHRDERGEILSGGNVYVGARWGDKAIAEIEEIAASLGEVGLGWSYGPLTLVDASVGGAAWWGIARVGADGVGTIGKRVWPGNGAADAVARELARCGLLDSNKEEA